MAVSWADVGELVKQRRQALRLSLREVAPIADLSVSTWQGLEKGRPVNEQSSVKVAQALGWVDDAINLLLDGADPDAVVIMEAHELPEWEAELVATVRALTDVVRELATAVTEVRLAQTRGLVDHDETE